MQMSEKKVVAGVDLGPAADNHSMGVLVATKERDTWSVKSIPTALNYQNPNAPYIKILQHCNIIVIDAPLWFESENRCRRWEDHLIELAKERKCFQSWKPSQTHALYSHAWRAKDLLRGLGKVGDQNAIYEIYPAAWFALTYKQTQPENWKGKEARLEKRNWGFEFQELLIKEGIRTQLGIEIINLNADELDALPSVFCAILISENRFNLIKEMSSPDTAMKIAFPSVELWSESMKKNWAKDEFHAFVLDQYMV